MELKHSQLIFVIKAKYGTTRINVLQKDVAEKTGINLRTLQRRFENPSGFTIDELIKISEMLDIKFGFVYAAASNPITISPSITPNTLPTWSDCEHCWWYQQQKANPNPTINATLIIPTMKTQIEKKIIENGQMILNLFEEEGSENG